MGALLRGITALRYYWLPPAAFLAAIAGLMMHSAAAQSPYDCASWSAWMDRMPGPGAIPTLRVRGQCAFRVVGYRVEMRPHLPPSADPNVFLMDLAVHAPAAVLDQHQKGVKNLWGHSKGFASQVENFVITIDDEIAKPIQMVD